MGLTRRKIVLLGIFVLAIILGYIVQEHQHHAEVVPVVPGTKAPEIEVRDLQGRAVSLSDYRGKLVFLNFWATWCPPCRDEMPSMERLYKAMKDKPFVMMAVSVDTDVKTVQHFREAMGYTFPMLIDIEQRAASRYQTTGVPETFIISPDGQILYKIIGPENWGTEKSIGGLLQLLPKT
jgi:peroxiredoxin